MKALILTFLALAACGRAWALWPFGSDESEPRPRARVSTMLEPVNKLIDEATGQCERHEYREAVKTAQKAQKLLEEIKRENFSHLGKPEFATFSTKQTFIKCLIGQAEEAARRKDSEDVKVTDTAELEKKLEFIRLKPSEKVVRLIGEGKYAEAQQICQRLCTSKTNDVVALNLYAASCAAEGNFMAARSHLEKAIRARSEDPVSYYNMARLLLQASPSSKESAREYYENGRALGGPKDEKLEKMLK